MRIWLAAILVTAICVALVTWTSGREAENMANEPTRIAADLKAIEELHQRDIEATRTYDTDTLASLWTDDIVALPPGQAPVIGKETGQKMLAAGKEQSRNFETLQYNQQWQEVKVLGDYAYEWGKFTSTVRVKSSGQVARQQFNVLRILQRTSQGWKVHRTIWNQGPKVE